MAGQTDVPTFPPEELEFIGEDEMIEIIPNMRMNPIHMICGVFGPFFPNTATEVPLWVAIALRKRSKCRIRPPKWLSVENLKKVFEAERESPKSYQPLPFHYLEISKLLFEHALEDISNGYMVRQMIEDILQLRLHKVENDLEAIESGTLALKLNNLSAMEVNIRRPFLVRTLQSFHEMDRPSKADGMH